MRIQVVDIDDQLLGFADYYTANYNDIIYRVSALLVTNSQGQVLLAKRATTLDHHPAKWGTTVAGTLENNESYDSSIYKEAEEEIGLAGVVFTKGPKLHTTEPRNYFCQWYFASIDMPANSFNINEEEVDKLAWFDVNELKQDLVAKPEKYIPNTYNTMLRLGLW